MKMWMEWTTDAAVLHIEDRAGRVEVRGSNKICTPAEPVGDPIRFAFQQFSRKINISKLMADEVVHVWREEQLRSVDEFLAWHERVTSPADNKEGVWL